MSVYRTIGPTLVSIGQGQPTLQSMVGQNSDVNKGRNSVANLQKKDTLQSQRRSCQR